MQEKKNNKETEETIFSILRPVFPSRHIKKLLHPNKHHVKWNAEDIASAIALRSVSPKGYRFLRKKTIL